jgi:hypothetical protein
MEWNGKIIVVFIGDLLCFMCVLVLQFEGFLITEKNLNVVKDQLKVNSKF